MITGWLSPKQKPPDLPRQSVSAIVQAFVVGSQSESFDGMLNAMRFVVPIGGGFAFEALTACLSVQPAPHVVPPVSAVDVTVNVINGGAVGVGVGVGVTSGEVTTLAAVSDRRFGLSPRFWPRTASAIKTPIRQNTNPIKTRRVKKAESEVRFFFMGCCDTWPICSYVLFPWQTCDLPPTLINKKPN